MTASSSALWSRFSPPSNCVNGHVSTMWFMVCRWPQSQEGDWARPHLYKLALHGPIKSCLSQANCCLCYKSVHCQSIHYLVPWCPVWAAGCNAPLIWFLISPLYILFLFQAQNLPSLQILPTLALLFFRTDSMDSPRTVYRYFWSYCVCLFPFAKFFFFFIYVVLLHMLVK